MTPWRTRLAMTCLCLLLLPGLAAAQTFQIQGGILVGQGDVGNTDYTVLGLQGRYYLRPVPVSNVPFEEAPFVDKAAHVEVGYLKLDPDNGGGNNTLQLEGHFVTLQNYIFEVGVSRNDPSGNAGTSTDLSFAAGKYLDGRAAAMLHVDLDDDNADTTTIGVSLHRLNDGSAPATWWSYDIGASLISADHTGFNIDALGTWYLSQQLGLSAGIDLTKIDGGDETTFELGANYFINELMAGAINYSTSSGDGPDRSTITLGAMMRF